MPYLSIILVLSSLPASSLFDSVYCRYRAVAESSRFEQVAADTTVDEGDIMMSGTKSFAVDFKQGTGTFEQGLLVNFTGRLARARVEGNFSDQGIPSETRGITEVDKMRLGFYTDNFGAEIGDLDVVYPFGLTRGVAGGSAFLEVDRQRVRGLYGQSKGRFSSASLAGVEGKQGPYLLIREGQIVVESEKLYLNGSLMKRGDDYYIDYETGAVTFATRNLVTNRSRIEADFQYSRYAYPLLTNSIDGIYYAGPVKTGLFMLREYNDPSEPQFFTLTPEEKQNLRIIGDDSTRAFRSGVDSIPGDYRKIDDHFVYVGGDSGNYKVTFANAGAGNGSYTYDRAIHAFRYVGQGLGSYEPRLPIPLPKKTELYAAEAGFGDAARVEYYVSRNDRNLYSGRDDQDNSGQGGEVKLRLDRKQYFLNASQLLLDDNFVFPGRKYDIDYQYHYNINEEIRRKTEIGAGVSPLDYLRLVGGYGLVNSSFRRITGGVNFFSAGFGLEMLNTMQRYQVVVDTTVKWFGFKIEYAREVYDWRTDRAWDSDNRITIRPVKILALRGGYRYEHDTMGIGRTRQAGLSIGEALEVDAGLRNFARDEYFFANARTRLVTAYLSLGGAFEKTNTAIQELDEVFRKVTPGQGNYVYDPVQDEYLPKRGGDYVREVVRLDEFKKISAYRYSLDAMLTPTEALELAARIDGVDEELFVEQNIAPTLTVQAGDMLSFDLAASRSNSLDRRYLGASERNAQSLAFEPRYRGLKGHTEAWSEQLSENDITEERRSGYRNWLIQDLRLKLDWWVKAGYNHEAIEMDYYYPGLGRFLLYEPHTGIGAGCAVGKVGRIDAGTEFLFRRASIDSLPFSVEVGSPLGFNQDYSLTGSYNLNSYTVVYARYHGEKRPDEKVAHDFRAELKLRF